MWKFFGKKFALGHGRSSGASVNKTPSGSLADLRGKFYLDKVSLTNYSILGNCVRDYISLVSTLDIVVEIDCAECLNLYTICSPSVQRARCNCPVYVLAV